MLLLDHKYEKDLRGLHLARISEILCWSAPVYVLDIAGTDSVHHVCTPVTGCGLIRPFDASVIETALLDLRNRLAGRSAYQLADNGEDTYVSELSKRLDTCSATARAGSPVSRTGSAAR